MRSATRLFARKGYRGASMRDLARHCGVRMFTIQHHFGSKRDLYDEILRAWHQDVEDVLERVLAEERAGTSTALVGQIVDELFDLYLRNRERVRISARALLGEEASGPEARRERGWVSFMSSTMRARKISAAGLDVRLLLISVDGVLNNHALAVGLYRRLFGSDVTEPKLARKTKAHLKQVILRILGNPPREDEHERIIGRSAE